MKKVLLTTTALVMTAGVASADLAWTFKGEAGFYRNAPTAATAGVDGVDAANTADATAAPDANADGFIAYDSVTEANCIAWAQAQVGQEDVEAAVAAKIEADKNPTSAAGVPWATE